MRILVLALVLLTACASLNQPPTPDRPEVELRQQGALFFGSGGDAPLNLSVGITNRAKEAIVVRRIRITAGPGMTQYSVRAADRNANETIAPGETKELHVAAMAFTEYRRLTPTEPLSLRTVIDYNLGGKRHQELYVTLVVGE